MTKKTNYYFLHGFLGDESTFSSIIEGLEKESNTNNIYNPKLLSSFVDKKLSPEHNFIAWAENFNKIVKKNYTKDIKNILIGYSMGGRLGVHAFLQNQELWSNCFFISSNPGLIKDNEVFPRQAWEEGWQHQIEKKSWVDFLELWNKQEIFKTSPEWCPAEDKFDKNYLKLSLSNWSLTQHQVDLSLLDNKKINWLVGQNDEKYKNIFKELKNNYGIGNITLMKNNGHRIKLNYSEFIQWKIRVKFIKNWLSAFRVKTLTAALVPIIVATSIVSFEGYEVRWALSAWAILSATLIQIATNLFNDAIDFKKGADTVERLGPKRMTQSGLISQKKVLIVAVFCSFLAAACGIPLVISGGLPILVLGLVSIIMGYFYTGGPFPLAYKGLGDLFVILFFGLAAVCGTFYIHVGFISVSSVVAGFQIGFLSTVLIAINNLRDREQDVKVNKLTMAVRFGELFTKIEISLLYFFSFLFLSYWYMRGAYPAIYLSLVTFPITLLLLKKLYRAKPGPIYNSFLAKAALIHLLFGCLFSVGLYL